MISSDSVHMPPVHLQKEDDFPYFLAHAKVTKFLLFCKYFGLYQFQHQFHISQAHRLAAVFFNIGAGEVAAPDNVVPGPEGQVQVKAIAFGIVFDK